MRAERPVVFEYLVFGLAFVLAAILAFYGFERWRVGAETAVTKPSLGSPQAGLVSGTDDKNPPVSGGLRHSGTVTAVASLPALRGSPAPFSSKKRGQP